MVFILLGVFLLGLIPLYINYDRKGYYYGLECNFCKKDMPYGLTPVFYSDYPQRFYLLDDDDLELVGSGFRYRQSSFKVKDFLAYGYNDTSVLVKCTDSLNTIKYLVSYEIVNKNKKGNPEISFKDLSDSDLEQIKNNYQWVDLDGVKRHRISIYKTLSFLGALLLLLILVQKLVKSIRGRFTKYYV